jgi:hypothetical protein
LCEKELQEGFESGVVHVFGWGGAKLRNNFVFDVGYNASGEAEIITCCP